MGLEIKFKWRGENEVVFPWRHPVFQGVPVKPLIITNFVTGGILAVFLLVSDLVTSGLIGLIVMATSCLVMAVYIFLFFFNLIYFFAVWRKYRWRGLVPFGTFLGSVVLAFLLMWVGYHFVVRNTPCNPQTFMTGQNRIEMTAAARWLDEHGSRTARPYKVESLEVGMLWVGPAIPWTRPR